MNRIVQMLLAGGVLVGSALSAQAKEFVLTPVKDSFMRSNAQIRSGGGSEHLIVSRVPYIKSLIAFDLSGITNVIEKAELQVWMMNTMPDRLALVVVPMVATANNQAWGEGSGRLGVIGQNAARGDASYLRSASPDVSWEGAGAKAAENLSSPSVWDAPVASLNAVDWQDGRWLPIPIAKLSLLENAVASEVHIVTFGLWGQSGSGIYYMGSRESDHAPKLVLTLKD